MADPSSTTARTMAETLAVFDGRAWIIWDDPVPPEGERCLALDFMFEACEWYRCPKTRHHGGGHVWLYDGPGDPADR